MLEKIKESYKGFEKITNQIMKNGLCFCLFLSLISVLILVSYTFSFPSPLVYYIGISLFRLSLFFATFFVACGFIMDGIKKQSL